jgi:hypothetical protein
MAFLLPPNKNARLKASPKFRFDFLQDLAAIRTRMAFWVFPASISRTEGRAAAAVGYRYLLPQAMITTHPNHLRNPTLAG